MNKYITFVLAAIFSLSLFSCDDEPDNRDYTLVYYMMEVYNDKGENLLDADNPNNIIGSDIVYNNIPGYKPRKVAWERISGDNDGPVFTYNKWFKAIELFHTNGGVNIPYRFMFDVPDYTCDITIRHDVTTNETTATIGDDTEVQAIETINYFKYHTFRLIIPSGEDTSSSTIN